MHARAVVRQQRQHAAHAVAFHQLALVSGVCLAREPFQSLALQRCRADAERVAHLVHGEIEQHRVIAHVHVAVGVDVFGTNDEVRVVDEFDVEDGGRGWSHFIRFLKKLRVLMAQTPPRIRSLLDGRGTTMADYENAKTTVEIA